MTWLVFAHAGDDEAARIARELGATLVTPRGLSRRGWVHYPVGGGADALPLGERIIEAAELRGVITRIAAVQPADLPHILETERGYVAAEMTAFLLSFLDSLTCPMLNRPSATSLMGPGWTAVRWRASATAAGFTCERTDAAGTLVVVVGERCFGAPDARTAEATRALSRRAGVELLGLRVTAGARFVREEPWCHLDAAALAAVRAHLEAA